MYQTRFKAIVYRSTVEDLNVPKVYESGVHPLDVDKLNPTKVFVDSDFAGADGRSTVHKHHIPSSGPAVSTRKV